VDVGADCLISGTAWGWRGHCRLGIQSWANFATSCMTPGRRAPPALDDSCTLTPNGFAWRAGVQRDNIDLTRNYPSIISAPLRDWLRLMRRFNKLLVPGGLGWSSLRQEAEPGTALRRIWGGQARDSSYEDTVLQARPVHPANPASLYGREEALLGAKHV